MPELTTPAGKPVDAAAPDAAAINADFTAAMNDSGPDEQAPPRRQPRQAPAEDTGKPKRGRPPKDEKSRTTDKTAAVVKDDYTEDAQNFVGTVWTVAASIPVTQPYALVVESNSDGLVLALAEGAKHNATIRSWVSTGQSSWMLGLASVGLSMGMQTWQLMSDPELRAEAAQTTREHLKAAMRAKGIQVPEPEPADVAAGA